MSCYNYAACVNAFRVERVQLLGSIMCAKCQVISRKLCTSAVMVQTVTRYVLKPDTIVARL